MSDTAAIIVLPNRLGGEDRPLPAGGNAFRVLDVPGYLCGTIVGGEPHREHLTVVGAGGGFDLVGCIWQVYRVRSSRMCHASLWGVTERGYH
jgi:hypothetical protein